MWLILLAMAVFSYRIYYKLSKKAKPGADFIEVIQNAFSVDNRVETVFVHLSEITLLAFLLITRWGEWVEDMLVFGKPIDDFVLLIFLGYIGVRIAWWVVTWFRRRDQPIAGGE